MGFKLTLHINYEVVINKKKSCLLREEKNYMFRRFNKNPNNIE
jgi:hypothetical protein